jgi:transcriptional regulator with XRE-family HTH domain
MNHKQLRQLLESAGVSQSEAARLIGITDRTLRRYIAGDLPVPRPVALALLYVVAQRVQPGRHDQLYAKITSRLEGRK